MAVAFTDPRSASFLYDDFDPEVSLVAPDLPQLNHMSATEIAEFLDQHTSSTRTQHAQAQSQAPKPPQEKKVAIQHTTPQPKTLQTSTDKGWTPLSESTPMDVPPGAQPKDLLKSRLSRLAQSAQAVGDDDDDVDSEVESDDSDDASKISHLQEDTPSKVRPPQLTALEKAQQQKQREIAQQQEQQLVELKELRDLKHFLLEITGGSSIVDSFKKGTTMPHQYELSNKQDVVQRDEQLIHAEEENRMLQSRITEVEDQLKNYMDELVQQKEATEEMKKINEVLETQKNDLAQKTDGLHQEIDELKAAQIQWQETQASLENDIETLSKKNKQLESNFESQSTASEKEITKLKNINEELKDESNVVKGTNMSLKEMVDVKDKIILDSQVENEKLKTFISELKKSLEDTTDDYNTLKAKSEEELLKLRGDIQERVSPERYPELLQKTSCGVPLYEDLELSAIDELTLVQAHNMLKNVLINLGIPFTQTKTAIKGISKQIQREYILREFASKTHKLLYDEDMNLEYYMDADQRGREHLSHCTTQMYKNLELAYAVVNKK